MLTTVVLEALEPPGPTIDEQLSRQIDEGFCNAGGEFRKHTHRKYGGDHCPTCQPKLSLAEAVWGVGPLADLRAEILDSIAAVKEGMS